jgi:SAM-dependent methyltransferase
MHPDYGKGERDEFDYKLPVELKRIAFIRRHLKECGARTILELGCGCGNVMRSLYGYDALGVDLDPEVITIAQSRGLNVRVADARTFVGPDLPYDAVIVSEVLDLIPSDPADVIANVVRNVRNGGLFILTATNGYGYWKLQERLRRWPALRRLLGKKPIDDGLVFHHHFTWRRLHDIAVEAGFVLIDQDNSDFVNGARASDSALASRLPTAAVSGWYFAFNFAANRT